MQTAEIDITNILKASLIFRAINHPLRRSIFEYLAANDGKPVTEIYRHFRIEQSVASQHLAILRKEGLVNTRRDRRFVLYTANLVRLEQVQQISGKLLQHQ